MGLLDKVKSMLWCKTIRHVQISPDSVKTNDTINALALQSAEMKAKEAKRLAEEAKQRESEKDIAEEDLTKIELDKRKNEISGQKIKFFSLRNFFNKYLNDKKFQQNLKILTWDRGETISYFKDLGFSPSGELFLIGDENRIVMRGKEIKDIFQHPPAIENDAINGCSMVINMDKEGNFIENIQTVTLNDIIPNGEGGFVFSAKKKPLYEYLNEFREQLGKYQERNEEQEQIIKDLEATNDELKRANRVLEKQHNISRSNQSETEAEFSSMTDIFNKTAKELTQQRLLNKNSEEYKEALQTALEVLRDKANRSDSTTHDETAIEKLNNSIKLVQTMIEPLALERASQVTPPEQPKKEEAHEN